MRSLTLPLLTPLPAVSALTMRIPATAGALRLEVAGVTSTGHKCSRNEDSFLVQHLTWFERQSYQLSLIILADGVGGHAARDLAAALVIRTAGGKDNCTVVAVRCY